MTVLRSAALADAAPSAVRRSIGAGDVGVGIDVVTLALRNDGRLQTRLARPARLRLAVARADTLGLRVTRIGSVSDGKMTRRDFFVGEHARPGRKLRALSGAVAKPAEIFDDAPRVRIDLRTEA